MNGAMKRAHVPRSLAPAPRPTPWVPGLIATAFSLIWLIVLSLV